MPVSYTHLDVYKRQISGSVRKPGSFAYGPGFTLKDLVVLAGGFTTQAATNRIEVFRVMLDENRPTKIVVATLTLRRGDVVTDNKAVSYTHLFAPPK